ncbi:MAG: polyketide synthase dehydratase domain-containing protein [Spirochaetes bacterium]|nr:polyketide synthase dehydratase domain-containing protein [Spirochaetota bacterium]
MEDLPEINRPTRVPITIGLHDYLRDHVFQGRAVFPAVEAMRILAASALKLRDDMSVTRIINADFGKFLFLDPDSGSIEAFNEIELPGDGSLTSKLVTLKKSDSSSITRPLEHASLSFAGAGVPSAGPPLDFTLGLEGICLQVDSDRIYRELVPFGPAFRNIESLLLSEEGALATISGGTSEAPDSPLGSPFPLDAAFHAACAWGQRFAGIVGFPVHIDERVIKNRTMPGENYFTRAMPVTTEGGLLVFDLWIYDAGGGLREEVRGLHMKDVSGGRLRPPEWIAHQGGDPLEAIRARCAGFSVIELAAVTKPCEKILAPDELERFGRMREKRGKSFCAARMALKKLSRRTSGNEMETPSHRITTVGGNGRPLCPAPKGVSLYCTASHDSRFAVAAISENRIGIDVEEISGRVLKGQRLYMHPDEMALAKSHPMGEMEASTRIWSIKEAVAKALGINLAQAWKRTVVEEIRDEKSIFSIDENHQEAIHSVVKNHIFTTVIMH